MKVKSRWDLVKAGIWHAVKKLRGPWGVGRWVGQELLRWEAWRKRRAAWPRELCDGWS